MQKGYVVKWSPDNTRKGTPWKIVLVNDCALLSALASFYKVHENYWDAWAELCHRNSPGTEKILACLQVS
jgi:hypothetical protein